MKSVDVDKLDDLPGLRLKKGDTFRFRCHSGLDCFNRCCRNLNLFLYPYDVVRLKNRLGITSDRFLEEHVDVVLRPEAFFPDVLLRMAPNPEKTCPFLTETGCSVYPDRPDTCRTFPVEQGVIFNARAGRSEVIHLFRPPDFCLGQYEDKEWTPCSWAGDQAADDHNQMTAQWAELRRLFETDPWAGQGIESPRGKMAFMATYNMDRFREFVFNSSFSKRYKIQAARLKQAHTDDTVLTKLGFSWVKLFLWGIPSRTIQPR